MNLSIRYYSLHNFQNNTPFFLCSYNLTKNYNLS